MRFNPSKSVELGLCHNLGIDPQFRSRCHSRTRQRKAETAAANSRSNSNEPQIPSLKQLFLVPGAPRKQTAPVALER